MTRRTLMRMAAACAAASFVPKLPADEPCKHGLIRAGIDTRGRSVKCYVDGVDVTNVCRAANDVEGWAECFEWEGYPNALPSSASIKLDLQYEFTESSSPVNGGQWHQPPPRLVKCGPRVVMLRGDVRLVVDRPIG